MRGLVGGNASSISCCVSPHPSRYSLDTFSRLGEVFYSCALCKKLGFSSQQSHSAAPDSRTQPRPRGSGQRSWTPGLAKPNQRGKAGSERRKACFRPGGSGFHLSRGRVARATPSLKPASFPSTTQVLWYFLDSRKYRTPIPLSPPHSAKFSAESVSGMLIKESGTSPTMMLSAIRICVCTSTALAPVGSTRRTTARISSQILWRV